MPVFLYGQESECDKNTTDIVIKGLLNRIDLSVGKSTITF